MEYSTEKLQAESYNLNTNELCTLIYQNISTDKFLIIFFLIYLHIKASINFIELIHILRIISCLYSIENFVISGHILEIPLSGSYICAKCTNLQMVLSYQENVGILLTYPLG